MPKPRKSTLTASTADKHLLYQKSVQSPEADLEFAIKLYRARQRRTPFHFREDFCGTALLAATWAGRGARYTAEGFDIDPDPLAWGRTHNLLPLGASAERVLLHQADVREPSRVAPDLRCAQNFSWFAFKTRLELEQYFLSVHQDLAHGGVFLLDIFGGPQSMEEMYEESDVDGEFTYVWDQDAYFPVTGEYRAHIHFYFKDGTRLERAFSYDWRMWTIPEAVDTLRGAGFDKIDVYWEQIGSDGVHGNGEYRRTTRGENWSSWVAYLVCQKM